MRHHHTHQPTDNPVGSEITRAGPFNLAPYSADILLIVVFPASRSKNLPIALGIAAGAKDYAEAKHEGATLHLAAFGREPDQVAKARSLLRIVGSWRGTQVFGGGRRMVSAYNADELLACYAAACSISPRVAHCHVGDHPCRLLEAHTQTFFFGGRSPGEKLAAAAVRRGVEWCPFLEITTPFVECSDNPREGNPGMEIV